MSSSRTARGLTRAVFQNQPDQILRDYDLVQSGDVWVDELSVVVDLSGEIRVAFVGGLEDDLGKAVLAVTL